ncbi:MAG: serine hydrolase [Eubacteriales bacterium]|nr:serine hydrolase [Eubacteriales bacterium]
MLRKTTRLCAAALAAAMLLAQTAYADSVVTAQQPGAVNGEGSFVSDTGPTGSKVYGSDGYLVVGSNGRSANEYVNSGPGVVGNSGSGTTTGNSGTSGTVINGQQSSTGTAQQPGSTTGTTQTDTTQQTGTAAGQIRIDTSIAQPQVASEAAILYDATTGQTLYGKNADTHMHPASTTKLMTALLTAERLQLTDTVTYSQTATHGLESGAANVSLDTGDTLSVKDSLYALLLKSACEVANGLGEKISGSQAAFAQLMNQRAKELGCNNTNFVNASGLNDDNHYTTVHDMALITKAALDNTTVRTISSTINYTLPASKNRGQLAITNGHKMLNPSDSRYYAGVIGGKTGYTSKAGNTLTTAMVKDGHELIAVVFKSKQKQYDDTKALFDYGVKLLQAAGVSGGSQSTGTTTGSTQSGAGWIKVSDTQWQYKKPNGSLCKSEWLDLNGSTYWFDDTTYMATGWRHFSNGAWYYFNPQNGAMVTEKWVTDDGKSYYLQKDGTMATNTVINNTYQVDENGVYVKKLN